MTTVRGAARAGSAATCSGRGFDEHRVCFRRGPTFLDRRLVDCLRVIPEIDIWRAATLMLKRYGENALEQSATRADELAAEAITTAR